MAERSPIAVKSKTDEELYELARDIVELKVFTSSHVRTPKDLALTFMPLGFMDKDGIKELQEKVGMLYEYIGKAAPTCVNGMPMFFSMQLLHKDDYDRLLTLINKIKKSREQEKESVIG